MKNISKVYRGFLVLGMFFSVQSTALAQLADFFGGIVGGTVGTKFVCCSVENVSCLGGGGATIFQPILRDRAITQADARIRCGFSRMYWATHSCPRSTDCPGDVGIDQQSFQRTTLKLCNANKGGPMYATYGYYHKPTRAYATIGWYRIEAGACTNLNLDTYEGYTYLHAIYPYGGDVYHYGKGPKLCYHPTQKFHFAKADLQCVDAMTEFFQFAVKRGVNRFTFNAVQIANLRKKYRSIPVFEEASSEVQAYEVSSSSASSTEVVSDEHQIEKSILEKYDRIENGDQDWDSPSSGRPGSDDDWDTPTRASTTDDWDESPSSGTSTRVSSESSDRYSTESSDDWGISSYKGQEDKWSEPRPSGG